METFPAFLQRHGFGVVGMLIEEHQDEFDRLLRGTNEYFMFIPKDADLSDFQRNELQADPQTVISRLANRIADAESLRATSRLGNVRTLDRAIFHLQLNENNTAIVGFGLFIVGRRVIYQGPNYRIRVHPIRLPNPEQSLESFLRERGFPTMADVLENLSPDERQTLNGRLRGDLTQMFMPTEEVLAAFIGRYPNKLELITGWLTTGENLRALFPRNQYNGLPLTMLDGSDYLIEGTDEQNITKVSDVDVIDRIDEPYIGDNINLYVDITDRVLAKPQPLNPEQALEFGRMQQVLLDLQERTRLLAEAEFTNYGTTDTFTNLDRIWREVRENVLNFRGTDAIDFATYVDRVNVDLQKIQETQHVLGRRCINIRDFADGSKVFEARDVQPGLDIVPENEFIRLRNGVCWDMDSLMNFIVLQQGYNSIIDPKSGRPYAPFAAYPGVTNIWENDAELQRILNHPAAKATDFRAEYNQIVLGRQVREAEVVSNRTLDMMERTGRLLASEGPVFAEELDKLLDERQRQAWREANGNPDLIVNQEDQRNICTTIVTTIKSNALAEWNYYWRSLRQEERDFIVKQNPNFAAEVQKCVQGQLCVYLTTGTFFSVRNAIARIKNLPLVERITRGLDPAKSCQGISERIMTRQEEVERAEMEALQAQLAREDDIPVRGIGIRVGASENDARFKVSQTNGFISRNLANVFATLITRRMVRGPAPPIRAHLFTVLGIAENTATQDTLHDIARRVREYSAQEVHALFTSLLVEHSVEEVRESLWQSLGDVTLRRLLSGYGIIPPEAADGRQEWKHNRVLRRGQEWQFAELFSRFVFDLLFDAYVERGANGDRFPPRTAARRRAPRR